MRKLQITAIGAPAEVLELVEFQASAPGAGQVLVEVQAATINASDFLYISGQYFATPQPPSDVGAEGVGQVMAVGPDVEESLVGARVLLLPTYRHGTWATHLIAATTDIVVVPDDIDILQLAMAGINPMTALLMLRNFGDPARPGRWIGQTAGNSAVGRYVIQLARRFGWKTLSVVRRQAAAELVRSWGSRWSTLQPSDWMRVKVAPVCSSRFRRRCCRQLPSPPPTARPARRKTRTSISAKSGSGKRSAPTCRSTSPRSCVPHSGRYRWPRSPTTPPRPAGRPSHAGTWSLNTTTPSLQLHGGAHGCHNQIYRGLTRRLRRPAGDGGQRHS